MSSDEQCLGSIFDDVAGRHSVLKPRVLVTFSNLLVIVGLIMSSQRVSCHGDGLTSAVRYDKVSFEENVAQKAHFVMFFAPWCGHCKRLSPVFEELAEKIIQLPSGQLKEDVIIAKVDCTTDTPLCSEQDVTGYPTLKFFKPGSLPVRYRGKRDLESMEKFIYEQFSTEADNTVTDEVSVEVPKRQHHLVELGDDTFHKHVETGYHFVEFYVPWCSHCQKLLPIWEALADSYKHDGSVSISKVDCTAHSNVCQEYGVKGYPTLVWIQDGKQVSQYQNGRTHEELKAFITKMKGPPTEPVLESEDGRVPVLTISAVVQLTIENFQNGIASGTTFVKFYAPWCTHCKKLAGTWNELAKKYLGSVDVKIAKVDCTSEGNKQLCNENKVEGYPTLLLFKNGVNAGEYTGPRDLTALHEFVFNNIAHDEL